MAITTQVLGTIGGQKAQTLTTSGAVAGTAGKQYLVCNVDTASPVVRPGTGGPVVINAGTCLELPGPIDLRMNRRIVVVDLN